MAPNDVEAPMAVEKTTSRTATNETSSSASDIASSKDETTVAAAAASGGAATAAAAPFSADLDYPDGGLRAWLVAAGAAGTIFCCFGYVNAFGVYQEYYQTHQLREQTPSAISWIGSLQVFFLFGGSFFGGPLFDRFGGKILWPAGTVYLFSVMMTSICKRYWEFLLAQGILGGLMLGFCMAPPMAAVGQYFNRRRAAAMGLVVGGSSIGGVIFPIALTRMLYNSSLGFGWSVRICGFIMVPFLLLGSLTVRGRLPPRGQGFLILDAFKQPKFLAVIVSIWFIMIGLFTPFIYLPTFALEHGMSSSLSSYLLSILNGASFFGRVIPGIAGDKFGRVNVLSAAGVGTGILILCWPQCDTNAALIVFAALYGFVSGAIVSMMTTTLAQTADHPRNIGTYLGQGMLVIAIAALIGPPINGALVTKHHSFNQAAYLSGVFSVVGGIGAFFIKIPFGKKLLSRF